LSYTRIWQFNHRRQALSSHLDSLVVALLLHLLLQSSYYSGENPYNLRTHYLHWRVFCESTCCMKRTAYLLLFLYFINRCWFPAVIASVCLLFRKA